MAVSGLLLCIVDDILHHIFNGNKEHIKAHAEQAEQDGFNTQRNHIGISGGCGDDHIDQVIQRIDRNDDHKGIENIQKQIDRSLLRKHHKLVIGSIFLLNEPKYIVHVIDHICKVRGMERQELIDAVNANYRRLMDR